MIRLTTLLFLLAGPALAQDWNFRSGDAQIGGPELEARITGRDLVFYDDGTSRFSVGGAYSYTYSAVNGGSTHFGRWEMLADGQVCIVFRNGAARCDLYVEAGGRLVVLTEDGGRYPVRP